MTKLNVKNTFAETAAFICFRDRCETDNPRKVGKELADVTILIA